MLFARIAGEPGVAYLKKSAHRYLDTLDKIATVSPAVPAEAAARIIDSLIAGANEYLRIREGGDRRIAEAEKRGDEEEMSRELETLNREWEEYDRVWPARSREVIRLALGEGPFARYLALEPSRPRGAAGSDSRR